MTNDERLCLETWELRTLAVFDRTNHHVHDDFIKWKHFRVTGPLWVFPSQRPVTRSFDAFFGLRLKKRLSKQSRCQWFETPSRLLWHHCNVIVSTIKQKRNIFTAIYRWLICYSKSTYDCFWRSEIETYPFDKHEKTEMIKLNRVNKIRLQWTCTLRMNTSKRNFMT